MEATATAAPQHMLALAQANRVRLARAELKRQVAEGEATVAEIVLGRPWETESMSIADLLTPRVPAGGVHAAAGSSQRSRWWRRRPSAR